MTLTPFLPVTPHLDQLHHVAAVAGDLPRHAGAHYLGQTGVHDDEDAGVHTGGHYLEYRLMWLLVTAQMMLTLFSLATCAM